MTIPRAASTIAAGSAPFDPEGACEIKVLHVLPSAVLGGGEVATRRLIEAVRPSGVTSAVLLLQPTKELTEYFADAGVRCLSGFRRPEPSLVRDAPRFLRDSVDLARLCSGFDIIHCADTKAAYSAAIAGRLARRTVLCHVRNREADMPARNRPFIGAAHHFAFVSDATRKSFALELPTDRTSVLYDGVDLPTPLTPKQREMLAAEVRAEFGLAPDAVVAAMFARVHPSKDYPTLIRAAARLKDDQPRLRFLVVGDTDAAGHQEHFREMRNLAAAAGVLDRFVFAGFRDNPQRLMAAADICLHCTHIEGFPLVLIEAMAAGRPCIATAVDGIPEAVTDGWSGLLHAHEDAEGLAAAISRLTSNPPLAAAMGAAARIDAEERFGLQRFARDAFDLYARLSGVRDRPPVRARRDAPQV